jgi:hypothetical protein
MSDIAEQLCRETALLLGFADLEKLTAAQLVRVHVVSGLRLELDRLQGAQMRGEQIDARSLVAVGEALESALRGAEPAPAVADRNASRERLKALIERALIEEPAERAASELDAARAEIAELKEQLARAQAGAVPVVTAPSAEIVLLHKTVQAAPPGPDAESKARLAYAERLEQIMTRRGSRTEEWRDSYSTPFGIHNIPRGF